MLFFNAGPTSWAISSASLILRVGLSIALIPHGYTQWTSLAGGQPVFVRSLGLTETTLWSLTVCIIFFCSLCLMTGLLTRLVLVVLIGTELLLVLIAYQENSLGNDSAFRLLPIYSMSLLLGAGDYSLDALIFRR